MGKILSVFRKKKNVKDDEEEDQEELAYKAYLADKNSTRLIVEGNKIKKINHPIINAIFSNELITFEEIIRKLQQDLPKKEYEWNLCLCFWFAVHMKYIEFVKFMVDFDTNLKKIVYFSKKIGTKNSSIGGDDFSQDRDDSKDKNNHTNVGLMGNRVISKDEQSPVRLDQEKERSLQEDSEEEDWKQEGGENDDEDEGEGEQKDMNKVEPIQDNPTRQDINMMMRTDSSKRSNKLSQSSRNKKYDTEESQKRNSKYGKILDEEVSKKDEEDNDAESVKEKEKDLSKSFSSKSISVKGDKRNQSEGSAKILMTDPLLGQVINGIDIEKITLDDEESLERVRFFLQNQAQVFIGNVLVLLVKENEEELACILCQYYKCNPQLELIERIVTKGFWTLLKYMWKYDKRPSDHLDVNNPDVFSFDDLLKFFKEYTKTEEEYLQYINKISGWKLKCKDNFLKGLLAHNHDDIALEQMGKYFHEMNQELLIFCLDKGKENFLNQSLYAFNKFIFRQDEVVEKLLELLKNGSQLNSYLNILTLVDISIWKINQIKALINIFEGYAYHEYETNQLLLSYNPLMTIALTCEILTHISNNKKKVAKSSNKVKRDLLALGQMFTSKIEDEDYYETLITDLDSRGRSLLKIITDNEFEPLMDDKDPKAENIMMSIYQGKEATKCDGSVKGYSSIYHFITTNPKKLEATDKGSKIFKFFKNYFEPNYNFDYSFQYRYRAHSINFIFMKEFLCSIALLVIFQYISYQYLTLFNIDNLSTNLTDTQLREKVTKNLSTYRGYNLLAFMCSFSLVFHIILKMLFNLCTKNTKKLPVDKWTILDAVTAILYVVSIFVISNVSVDTLLNSKKKSYLDYFILLVLCATWIRTFSFFLVIKDISKLLLTLVAMVTDTLAFIAIFGCFLCIMASVFTTLYQDYNSDKYGSLAVSFRSLFDTAMAVYDYNDMGTRELSHSILLVFVAFMSNILLLNFVIAILSTTYENMKESGIFKYRTNLFRYCDRYLISFGSPLCELILQPAPLCYLSVPLVIFICCEKAMKKAGKYFSYIMYWLENVTFVICFALIELALVPVMYIKAFYHIWYISPAMLSRCFWYACWLLGGFFFCLFLILHDCVIMLNLMSMHDGCQSNKLVNSEVVEDEVECRIFNQVRTAMLDLYDQVIFKERGETFSDNNRGLTKSITNLIRGSSSLTKSMFTMRKTDRINQKFFKPAPEDHEFAEKLTCSIGAILDNWKTKFYQNPQIKTGFSNLINRFRDMSKTPEKFKTIRDNESQKNNNNPSGTLSPLQLRPMDNSLQNLNDEPIVPEKDQKIAQEFLQRFLLNEEGSSSNQINLLIFFNSLPHYIEGIYYKRAKMFCIKLFQESLVAYKNIEDVNAHEFHDERNRDRVQLVKKQIAQQKAGLKTIRDCLKILESTVEAGAQKMGVRLNDTSEEEFQEEKKLYNAETNF